jgi:dihydrofolate reductase
VLSARQTASDVSVGGGADVVQQFLRAGLVDEMEIHVVPLFLGGGSRRFDNLDGALARFDCIDLVSSPAVAHYTYVRKAAT